MLLFLERHRTLDVEADTPLTLRVVHTCADSSLSVVDGASLPPCLDAAISGRGAAAERQSSLSASLAVRSGGAPPARPGAPWLRHLSSYSKLMLVWSAPPSAGSSPITAYAWVEYIGGRPVLTHSGTWCLSWRRRTAGATKSSANIYIRESVNPKKALGVQKFSTR